MEVTTSWKGCRKSPEKWLWWNCDNGFHEARLFWKPKNTQKTTTRLGSILLIEADSLLAPLFMLMKVLKNGADGVSRLHRFKVAVWMIVSWSHTKLHAKFTNERVLIIIFEVRECKVRTKICHSQYTRCFFRLLSIAASFEYVKHNLVQIKQIFHVFTRLLNVNAL